MEEWIRSKIGSRSRKTEDRFSTSYMIHGASASIEKG
jgi:hypothetical protein